MRTMFRTVFGLSLVALVASPAFAQGQGRGFGMGGGGLAMLIGNESVQKELKLDDKQVEKAKEFAEKAREKVTRGPRDNSGPRGRGAPHEDARDHQEMNETAMKAFGEFLKPEQIARLKQISYQRAGRGLQRPRGRQEAEPHRHPEDARSRRSTRSR